jgi:hypothetical protein
VTPDGCGRAVEDCTIARKLIGKGKVNPFQYHAMVVVVIQIGRHGSTSGDRSRRLFGW